VEDIVEPWSERKGSEESLRSALVVSISGSGALALPITARVYLPLTFELRFVCALSGCSQSLSQLAIAAPAPFDAKRD
jgi:hypothetical protein